MLATVRRMASLLSLVGVVNRKDDWSAVLFSFPCFHETNNREATKGTLAFTVPNASNAPLEALK